MWLADFDVPLCVLYFWRKAHLFHCVKKMTSERKPGVTLSCMMSATGAASVSVNNVRENTSSVMQESSDETEFKVESEEVSEHGSIRV